MNIILSKNRKMKDPSPLIEIVRNDSICHTSYLYYNFLMNDLCVSGYTTFKAQFYFYLPVIQMDYFCLYLSIFLLGYESSERPKRLAMSVRNIKVNG